MKVIAQP